MIVQVSKSELFLSCYYSNSLKKLIILLYGHFFNIFMRNEDFLRT